MKIPYFLIRVYTRILLRIFFRETNMKLADKKVFRSTICVSNHPSSFMDPLVVAGNLKRSFYFLTRSDVFSKPWIKKVLTSFQMIPIYRAHDGVDTKSKNAETFKISSDTLEKGNNLIIFGEGFTDDVFIRRLKNIKKGAARIAFGSLEQDPDIIKSLSITCVGINYEDPDKFRSRIVLSTAEPIPLKDYVELHREDPSKAITQLTRDIEKCLQGELVHVEKEEHGELLDRILHLSDKGMKRYAQRQNIVEQQQFSQRAAKTLNRLAKEDAQEFEQLQSEVNKTWDLLEGKSVQRIHAPQRAFLLELLIGLLDLPLFIYGTVLNAVPYAVTRLLTKKMLKRKVFFSSVKMILGGFLIFPLYYLLAGIASSFFISHTFWWGLFMISLPITAVIAYDFKQNFKALQMAVTHMKLKRQSHPVFEAKRKVNERITDLVSRYSN